MAQLVGSEFNPQNPCNSCALVVHACDSSPKDSEAGGSLELAGLTHPSRLGKYQTVRDPVTENDKEG